MCILSNFVIKAMWEIGRNYSNKREKEKTQIDFYKVNINFFTKTTFIHACMKMHNNVEHKSINPRLQNNTTIHVHVPEYIICMY